MIELATPHLVSHSIPPITAVTLAAGEALDQRWNKAFIRSLPGVAVDFAIHPALGYAAEQVCGFPELRKAIRGFLKQLLTQTPATVVWAHNLGIARNLILAGELARICADQQLPLVAHHHDWWFENRWHRWPEIQRCGARTLAQVAPLTIIAGPTVRHAAINRRDASRLHRHLGSAATWLPNLAGELRAPHRTDLAYAREWLNRKLSASWSGCFPDNSPVWIFPCRLLRRKNIAEALLLTRWLRPGAWLVTTGGASSADELAYAQILGAAAKSEQWPLHLGILSPTPSDAPGIPELIGVCETVLLTSIQEGFGLPYLEAVAARRPLIARALPNIAPDLHQFGFDFPQTYSEILIDPNLFNWRLEFGRQERLFHAWRSRLPPACRTRGARPAVLNADRPQPVPFNRLTLTAQLEVLRHDVASSWKACQPLNPFLNEWRRRAQQRRLKQNPWPATASRWLSGPAYAKRLLRMFHRPLHTPVTPIQSRAVQADFIRATLSADQLYPLLWKPPPETELP